MRENKGIILWKTKNKLYIFFKILLTTIFSVTILLDSVLVFKQELRAAVSKIYFSEISLKNIIIFIIVWGITFLCISILEYIVNKIENELYKRDETIIIKKRVFFIIFGSIILMWMPYILTYFPGGIFSDTQVSIKQCLHLQVYDNKNPLAYTLMLKVFIKIGDIFHNAQLGINLFGIFQIVLMAGIISYFIYWLYKKNFSNIVLVLITVFFGIFKLIPMYALSIWKDTPFCLALFVFAIFIAEEVYNNGKKLNNKKKIIGYCVIITIVSFLRTNGIYVALATTIIFIMVFRKNKILRFTISVIATFLLIWLIKGPIFTELGINNAKGGLDNWNAIMVNQIFYTRVTDGNITEEQNKLINSMCETSKLKEIYAPLLLDATTIDPAFNDQFIAEHWSDIKKMWFKLLLKNPKKYVQAYLLNTLGFWDVNKSFPDAYVSDFMWPGTEDIIDVKQHNYIEEWTGQSIKDKICNVKIYSSAIFLFAMLTSMIFTIKKKRYKNLLIYLPAIFTWGTIMMATPIAFSMRYVYILVLMVPFNFIIPFIANDKYIIREKEII